MMLQTLAALAIFASVSAAQTLTGTPVSTTPTPTPVTTVNLGAYLQTAQFQPRNRVLLAALGNRLQVPGFENIVLNGTLAVGTATAIPVTITLQSPGLFLITPSTGVPTIYNGSTILKTTGVVQQDEDLVNAFVFDFVDHYLLKQQQGASTRVLGTARVNVSGATSSVWNVVHMSDQAQQQGNSVTVLKQFGFNLSNSLLECVSYTLQLTGGTTHVQTMFENWQTTQGQALPGKVVRIENGTTVFTFQSTSASVGPAAALSLFTLP